jgi:hypothetical protein
MAALGVLPRLHALKQQSVNAHLPTPYFAVFLKSGSEAVQPLWGPQHTRWVPWPAGPDGGCRAWLSTRERSPERLAGWIFYFLRRVALPT